MNHNALEFLNLPLLFNAVCCKLMSVASIRVSPWPAEIKSTFWLLR